MEILAPAEVVRQFGLDGAALTTTRTGRIHDTCIAQLPSSRWILQRINTDVFADPSALMDNAVRARDCAIAAGVGALEYRRTQAGSLLALSNTGGTWRSYRFVEGAVTRTPVALSDVDRIARAFGEFAAALERHEPGDWHQVLPDFHDHHHRVSDFRHAVESDPVGRVEHSVTDMAALEDVIETLEALDEFEAWRDLPTRVAHHDAKAVNVVTQSADRVTILDLDTVMSGTVLSDVGELVRSCARSSDDDPAVFLADHARQVTVSFLAGWGGELTDSEREAMPIAGMMMTAQNAMRFMTDHIRGDRYYADDSGQFANLQSARVLTEFTRTQFRHLDDLRRYATTA